MMKMRVLLRSASASTATIRRKSTLVTPDGLSNQTVKGKCNRATPATMTKLCMSGCEGEVRVLLETLNPKDIQKPKLVRCARHLYNQGFHQSALSIFEWMKDNNFYLTPNENASLMNLTLKARGMWAGKEMLRSLGSDRKSPAYQVFANWYSLKLHDENSGERAFAANLPYTDGEVPFPKACKFPFPTVSKRYFGTLAAASPESNSDYNG